MTRQVALSEDAYALLTVMKRSNESYSDVVRRLAAEQPKDPMAWVGHSNMTEQEAERRIAEIERLRDLETVRA